MVYNAKWAEKLLRELSPQEVCDTIKKILSEALGEDAGPLLSAHWFAERALEAESRK